MKQSDLSKIISYALRHNPLKYGLKLISGGWVPIDELVVGIKDHHNEFSALTQDDIIQLIYRAKKKRHEIQDNFIRAVYGHSSEKIIYEPATPPLNLFHGTSRLAAENIFSDGLKPMERQYVHLSGSIALAIASGTRKDSKPIIIICDSLRAHKQGIKFYQVGNDVWLTEYLPAQFLIGKHESNRNLEF